MQQQYILIVRDSARRIMHTSHHATRAQAEKKANALGRKSSVNLFAIVYVESSSPHAAPDAWRIETNLAL